jgi:leader peptidase (prepilin peptidase)/N-methyltransferase
MSLGSIQLIFESLMVILFGLTIGSFLNVVIHRLPKDQSLSKPPSTCPSCGAGIKWYQNIPLFSYLFLKGKCGNCKAPIHWRYPLVELLTAILFFISWRGVTDLTSIDALMVISQFRIWFFIAICVAITFIDLEHRIIPDELSLGGWAFGFLTAYWDFRHGMGQLVLASLIGFGFFFAFSLIYEKITGRVGLGGGDIKFMGTIGIFLGFGGIWASLMISSIIGSVVGIIFAKIQKEKSLMRTSIPYGPFLVLGAFVELFFEVSKWLNL